MVIIPPFMFGYTTIAAWLKLLKFVRVNLNTQKIGYYYPSDGLAELQTF